MAQVVKDPHAMQEIYNTILGFDPRDGRAPGGGHGNPLQYSCLGIPMDRGAWQATVHEVTELDRTEAI